MKTRKTKKLTQFLAMTLSAIFLLFCFVGCEDNKVSYTEEKYCNYSFVPGEPKLVVNEVDRSEAQYRGEFSYNKNDVLLSIKLYDINTGIQRLDLYYNEKGDEIKRISYYSEEIDANKVGEIYNIIERWYDENGNIIKQKGDFIDSPSDGYIIEYEYDGNGNMIKSVRHNLDDGSLSSWTEWDSEGRKIKTIEYHQFDRTFIKYEEYEYHSDGKLKKLTVCNSDGDVEYSEEYEYNSDGKVKKTIKYDATDTMTEYILTEYSGSHIDKTKHYTPDGSLYIEKNYEYGTGHLKDAKYYNADGSLNHKNEYIGRDVIKAEYLLPDGTIIEVGHGRNKDNVIKWTYPDGTVEFKYTDDWGGVDIPEVIDFDKVNYK